MCVLLDLLIQEANITYSGELKIWLIREAYYFYISF